MTDHIGAERAPPRAFLRVAGASVAQHQIGLAQALDCQRVICLARGSSPELLAVQHAAENAGLQFYLAIAARQLAGLVSAADELIVVTEGLLADPAVAAAQLDRRAPTVLALPAETGVAEGFERIDINRASGGLMRLPGALVEQLHHLPPDVDAVSALTRIALQSGAEVFEIASSARLGARWRLIRNEAEAQAVEHDWLRASFGGHGAGAGGKFVARHAVLALGPALLHAGNASMAANLAVLAMVVLAALCGWFGFFWVAFLLLALGATLVEAGRLLRIVERRAVGLQAPAIPRADALDWLCDAALLGVVLLAVPLWPRMGVLTWLFAPVMLMLLIVLVPRVLGGGVGRILGDRATVCLLLTAAAVGGMVLQGVQLMAIGLAGAAILLPSRTQS